MVVRIKHILAFLILGNYSNAFTPRSPEIDFSSSVHLPKDSFGYLYGYTELEKETKAAERVFRWYNDRLKSFISEDGLDIEGFSRFSEFLGKDLADIDQWVKTLQPVKILSAQRNFANHMFKVMEDAVNILKFYDQLNTAQALFRWIVHFEVHLLTFYDVDGGPDTKIPNFEAILGSLSTSLNFWKELYYKLFGKSSDLNVLFDYYVNQAENRLVFLRYESIPDDHLW